MSEQEESDKLEAAYRDEHGLDGQWLPRECTICGAETRLRCAVCHATVCHLHLACPNGCDGYIAAEQ